MGLLTFVRHGQASFGSENYDQLSALGEWQASTLGRHFERAGASFTDAHCGDLERQKQTAHRALAGTPIGPGEVNIRHAFDEYPTKPVFAHHLPAVLANDAELNALYLADRTGVGRDRLLSRRVFFPVLQAWQASTQTQSFESFKGFRRRVVDGIDAVAQTANGRDHHVVFTSAGVVAIAVMACLRLPDSAFAPIAWQVHNASITQVIVDGEHLRLHQFNGVGHLEGQGREDCLTWL